MPNVSTSPRFRFANGHEEEFRCAIDDKARQQAPYLWEFFRHCCTFSGRARIEDVYHAYTAWCERSGEGFITFERFEKLLEVLGFTLSGRYDASMVSGLSLQHY